MTIRSTKLRVAVFNILAGSGFLALTPVSHAQAPAGESAIGLEEIIVTARRKEESAQDVPTVVNAVTGDEIQSLNIRRFEDIATVVPGLSMANNGNGIGATASVRGVNYDVNASGNNGTVEFYLNDAPISAGNLFQAVYDIGQVELLRGPQGTLRGRASPSGSMTVTTKRPDLSEVGGYVSATGTNIGSYNGQGAISFPVVTDKLGIRLAALYDKNEGNRVHSIRNASEPSAKTKSGRATISFVPTESLSFILTAQNTSLDVLTFDQVESQQVINPNAPVINAVTVPLVAPATYVPAFITAEQRLSVLDRPRAINNDFKNYNLQIQWSFAGQKLNYVGARNEQHLVSFEPQDIGDYFSPNANAVYQGFGQNTDSYAWATAHELRLSNEERLGIFDYIAGVFTQKLNTPTSLTRSTPVFNPTTTPFTQIINVTPIRRTGGNKEDSFFVNGTFHIGEATELSAGARRIKYEAQGTLTVAGNRLTAADENSEFSTTIWQAAAKHNFTDDLMLYGSIGTSWRPGISATGDFSLVRSPLETSFIVLGPEKSTSYEVGFKSTAFDDRIRANVALFRQKFKNYPYRSASGVFFVNRTSPTPTITPPAGEAMSQFNFVAAVPVTVDGLEGELNFAALPNWDIGASAAYSKGEIDGGFIPCNDFNPRDGVPDANVTTPASVAAFRAAAGLGAADTISGCTVTQRSSSAPQISGSLMTEVRVPMGSLNSFARGQLSVYGSSKNDPTNSVDDYSGYELLNVFFGLRGGEGAWEVSLYAKNVTNTEQVLTRSSSTMTSPLNAGTAPTNYYGGSASTGLTMTPPREFGLNVRYAFGSK